MKKSEVEALVAEVVKSELEKVTTSIEEISKSEAPETEPQEVTKNDGEDSADDKDEVDAEVVKSIVKDALNEALAPVTAQIESIKKSRALPSNLNDGPNSVSKSEEKAHYLHGII